MKARVRDSAEAFGDKVELVLFAMDINFAELFNYLKAYTGVVCNYYQPIIRYSFGKVKVTFESVDFIDQAGPFANILSRCFFHDFDSEVYKDDETGELGLWIIMDIRYQHKDHDDLSGMVLFRAEYANGKWSFANAGEEMKK